MQITETNVLTESAISQKTRELCETILQQPEFLTIRQHMDSFMADQKAQDMYESLSERGRHLQHKQQQGVELSPDEVSAFDTEREAFFRNPVAKNYVDAQETVHQMQQEITVMVTKTFELGRVPSAEDLQGGGCGSGCGCH